MNISVPDPMRDWVQARIDSGQYASVSDYVRDLIRRDQSLAHDPQDLLDRLDAAIARGLADADAGRTSDAEATFALLRDKYTRLAAQRDRS